MKQKNRWEKLRSALAAGQLVYDSFGAERELVVVEASSLQGLIADESGYRRASGGSPLSEVWNHAKHQEVALRMFRKHHMARRLLHLIGDFVVGDGIQVQAKVESPDLQATLQELIDEFWGDPWNAMDRKNEQRCIEWNLWGEICLPVRRNEATGQVRLGWITPRAIEGIEPDPVSGEPARVLLCESAAKAIGRPFLEIIRYVEDEQDPSAAPLLVGDCFYRAINTPWGADRGVSELYTASDWLDVLDNTLRAHADRAKLDSYFIWDITMKGKSEEWIAKWVAENQDQLRPRPNAVRVHNENVEWKCISPSLGSADMAEHIRTLKTYIMGGFGYPNHWFGSGDDANLATAAVMSEPTRKNLRRKQKQFRNLMVDIVKYALASYQAAGRLPRDLDTMDQLFDVQIPDLSGPDIAKVGAAMTAIAQAIQVGEDRGWVSHETAAELFAAISTETGIEIDASVEREKVAKADQEKAKQADAQAAKDQADLQALLAQAQAARKQLPAGGQASAASQDTYDGPPAME